MLTPLPTHMAVLLFYRIRSFSDVVHSLYIDNNTIWRSFSQEKTGAMLLALSPFSYYLYEFHVSQLHRQHPMPRFVL